MHVATVLRHGCAAGPQVNSGEIGWIGSASIAALGAAVGGIAVALVSESIRHHSEKWKCHVRALAAIERVQNANIGILWDNAHSLRQFCKEVAAERFPQVHCGPVIIDRTAELDVQSLEIANQLFRLNNQLRRHNDDMSNLFSGIGEVRAATYGATLPPSVYLQHLRVAARAAAAIRVGIRLTIREATALIAATRVQVRQDRASGHGLSVPWKREASALSHADVESEVRVMRGEMAGIMRASRSRVRALRRAMVTDQRQE